jgi:hypothetical protein
MAPQTPAPPVVQEIPLEPEQNRAPVQGIRHEVSIRAQFCYPLLSMNYPRLGNFTFSGSKSIIIKLINDE